MITYQNLTLSKISPPLSFWFQLMQRTIPHVSALIRHYGRNNAATRPPSPQTKCQGCDPASMVISWPKPVVRVYVCVCVCQCGSAEDCLLCCTAMAPHWPAVKGDHGPLSLYRLGLITCKTIITINKYTHSTHKHTDAYTTRSVLTAKSSSIVSHWRLSKSVGWIVSQSMIHPFNTSQEKATS